MRIVWKKLQKSLSVGGSAPNPRLPMAPGGSAPRPPRCYSYLLLQPCRIRF